MSQAANLYTEFTGHEADHYDTFEIEWPNVGLKVGKVHGIMYETIRDGVKEYYCHKFRSSSRPVFGVSHDGKQILVVGGKYEFTERGIVDK